MRDLLKCSIILLFLFFISSGLFSQNDFRDSAEADTCRVQRGIAEIVYSPAENDQNKPDKQAKEGKKIQNANKSVTGPDDPSHEKSIKGWIWIVTGFLLGLIAGAVIIYLYSGSKIFSILTTEKHKYLDDLQKDTKLDPMLREVFKYIGIVAILKRSKDEKKKEIENYAKGIVQLEKQNEKLIKEIEQKEKALTYQRNISYNQALASKHSDRQHGRQNRMKDDQMEIFFTIPESDGSFKTINARNSKEIDCFYKISPDESGQRGKLYFISGEYDLRALDNIDYYLNPVCEIQNITNRTFAKRIVMIDTGSVMKRGDYWKIDGNNKVKIKLV